MTEDTEITGYLYSITGELSSVTLPDGRAVSFIHDPLGRRIAKKVNGTTVEKYLWSGRTTLLAVYDGNDNLRQRASSMPTTGCPLPRRREREMWGRLIN
jgi:hypothetical protein